MKKEHRDEIKQDELASGLEKAATWAVAHRDEIRIGAGVVVVLLAAAGALAYFQGQRAKEADRAFRDALTTFEAPVASEIAAGADRPSGQVFATGRGEVQDGGGGVRGRRASLRLLEDGPAREVLRGPVARRSSGSTQRPRRRLKEIQSLGGGLEPELARLALADLYRRSGQVDKAVEAYRGMATNPTANVPRDYALLSAAQALEDAKRWPEARAAYRQVYEDFPASVFAAQARARVEYLQTLG